MIPERISDLNICNSAPVFTGCRVKTDISFTNNNKRHDLFILDLNLQPVFCNTVNPVEWELTLTDHSSSLLDINKHTISLTLD